MDIKALIVNSNLKQRLTAAIVTAAAAGGYWHFASATVTPQVAVISNMNKETTVRMTVLSGKDFIDAKTKAPKSTVINDTTDYKLSTLTVYIDRTKVPQLPFAALQGKTITVHGVVSEYKGKDGKSKPEIKVTSADQIKFIN